MIKILAIDDDADLLKGIRRILEMEGYKVITASSGMEGVRMIHEARPDLVLCDVMMPGQSGHWVIDQLQQTPEIADTPFILLTGETSPTDIRTGMALGADDYLCKPVVIVDLLASVRTRLAKRQAQLARQKDREQRWAEDFGRVLSHELRTPLGVIGPSLELLDQAASENSLREVIEVSNFARSGVSRLNEAVERVELYVSLFDPQGRTPTPMGAHPSASATILTVHEAERVAKKWQRMADLRVQVDQVTLIVDPVDFLPVVRELADNAFKFSKRGTVVTVGLRVEKGVVCLSVTDSGCGMSLEQITAATAFRQFDRSVREQQGLGIGLAIVAGLAGRMKGKFTLTPNPVVGLTALVELPISPAQAADRRAFVFHPCRTKPTAPTF